MELKVNDYNLAEIDEMFSRAFDELAGDDGASSQKFHEWFGIDQLEKYSEYSTVITAYEGDLLIGGAIVGKQNPLTWPDGQKCVLFIVGVLPEHRGKGVGEALIQKSEDIAKDMGAKSINLDTHVLMLDTQRYYLKLGYTQMGTLKDYYDNGDAVSFSKRLD